MPVAKTNLSEDVLTVLFWKRVGLSFARAFVGTFVLGATGAIAALGGENLDLNAGRSALIALVVSCLIAGFRAIQALTTQLETPPELKEKP